MVGFLVRPLHSVGRMEDFCLTRSGREVEEKWKGSGRGALSAGLTWRAGDMVELAFRRHPSFP